VPAHKRTKDAVSPDKSTGEPVKDKRGEYLTARQLADVLQISEATVHRLRRTGRIPAVVLTDRLIRFNLRDVQKALRPLTASQDHDREVAPEDQFNPQLSFDDLIPGTPEE